MERSTRSVRAGAGQLRGDLTRRCEVRGGDVQGKGRGGEEEEERKRELEVRWGEGKWNRDVVAVRSTE